MKTMEVDTDYQMAQIQYILGISIFTFRAIRRSNERCSNSVDASFSLLLNKSDLSIVSHLLCNVQNYNSRWLDTSSTTTIQVTLLLIVLICCIIIIVILLIQVLQYVFYQRIRKSWTTNVFGSIYTCIINQNL